MTTKNNVEVKEGRSGTAKLIIALCMVIIIGAIFAGVITVYNNTLVSAEEVLQFEGIFVDINGDGLDDYVRYAEVVINKGDFTVSP
jgi:hypothetical protein